MNTLHKWNKFNGNTYKFHSIRNFISKGYNSPSGKLVSNLYDSGECNGVLYDPCININFDE